MFSILPSPPMNKLFVLISKKQNSLLPYNILCTLVWGTSISCEDEAENKSWMGYPYLRHVPDRGWGPALGVFLNPPVVNFTNILQAAFTRADPKSAKQLLNWIVFFALLGSARVKAACRTLVKLTPGVNFTNILPAAFFVIKGFGSFSVLTVCVCNYFFERKLAQSCL